MVKPDELNYELSEIFMSTIIELFELRNKKNKNNSCLLIIYTKNDNELIKEIKEKDFHHSFVFDNKSKNFNFKDKTNISITSSTASGAGK